MLNGLLETSKNSKAVKSSIPVKSATFKLFKSTVVLFLIFAVGT